MAASHTALVVSSVATHMLAQWCLTAWYMRDRAAELDPLLGVGRGHLRALEGNAHRLGREEQAVAVDEGLASARDHGAGRAVEHHPGGAPGGVEVLGGVHGDALADLDDGDVVADRDEQHVGEPAAEHGAGVARRLAVRDRHRAAEGHGTEPRAVRQAGKPAPPWCRSSATASSVALTMTVGTNGPGATARPSSSTTTTSSSSP